MYCPKYTSIVLLALVCLVHSDSTTNSSSSEVVAKSDVKNVVLSVSTQLKRPERSVDAAKVMGKKSQHVDPAIKREKRHSKKMKVSVPVVGFATKKVKVEKSYMDPILKKALIGGVMGGAKMMMKKPKTKKIIKHVPAGLPVTHHVQETLLVQPSTTFEVTKVKTFPANSKIVKVAKMSPSYAYPVIRKKYYVPSIPAMSTFHKIKNHFFG